MEPTKDVTPPVIPGLDKHSYLPPRESYPFRSPYNHSNLKQTAEIAPAIKASETVPDQSLSVKDILTRYAQGLPLHGEKIPVYEGEEEIVPANWEKMDLSERADYVIEHKRKIEAMQRDLERQQKEGEKKLQKQQEKEPVEHENVEKPTPKKKPAPSAGKEENES